MKNGEKSSFSSERHDKIPILEREDKNIKTACKSTIRAATLLTVLILFSAASSVYARAGEAPEVEWDKTFGRSSWDEGHSVAQTSDGGYIIAGYTYLYISGCTDPGSAEYSDILLIKTDSDGNATWEKKFGGSDWDEGYSVAQTSDGGYIIAGRTYGGAGRSYDVWLIKLKGEENQPPVAEANGPYVGSEGSSIIFDASGSYDPNGEIVLYEWDWDNDGVYDESSTSPTMTHTWYDDYSGTIGLKVTDNGGLTATTSTTVTINNVPPTASIDSVEQPDPYFILPVVHTLTFRGSFTDPGSLDAHTVTWDFGDGTVAVGTTVTHAYSEPGTYIVTLTATDDDGGVGTDTWTLTVTSAEEAPLVVNDYIQDLTNDTFINNPKQRKNAFSEKLDEVIESIDAGEYQEAIDKLQNGIRAKADGTLDGNPKNDWITDPEAQREICRMIDDLIAYLETSL